MTSDFSLNISLLKHSDKNFWKYVPELNQKEISIIKKDSDLIKEFTVKITQAYKKLLNDAQDNLNYDFSALHNPLCLSLLTPEQRGVVYLYSLVNNDFLVHPFLVNEDFNLNEAQQLRNHNPDEFIVYKETERFEEFSRFQYVAKSQRNNAYLHLNFDYPEWILTKLMPIYDPEKCLTILLKVQQKNIVLAKKISNALLFKTINMEDIEKDEYPLPKKFATRKYFNICTQQILKTNDFLNIKNFSQNKRMEYLYLMDPKVKEISFFENFSSTYVKDFVSKYMNGFLEKNLLDKEKNSIIKKKI